MAHPDRTGPGRPRIPGGRGDQDRTNVSVPLSPSELSNLDTWRRKRSRADHLRRYGLRPGPKDKED